MNPHQKMTDEQLDVLFQEGIKRFNYTPKGRPLTRDEFGTLVNLTRGRCDQIAVQGTGPKFFKPNGGRALYAERDVILWLMSGERSSTSQQPAKAA